MTPDRADRPAGDLDEPVEVVQSDLRWPEWFVSERSRLAALVPSSVRIEHFGSTAVPGLDAKPVIDILAGVLRATDIPAVAEEVQSLGYAWCGEAGVPGRLLLRRRGSRAFNVSVTTLGGGLWEDNLLLRDFLRVDAAARRRYAGAKRAALAAGRRRLLAYSDAKSPTVEALLDQARAWRAGTGMADIPGPAAGGHGAARG